MVLRVLTVFWGEPAALTFSHLYVPLKCPLTSYQTQHGKPKQHILRNIPLPQRSRVCAGYRYCSLGNKQKITCNFLRK